MDAMIFEFYKNVKKHEKLKTTYCNCNDCSV